MSKILRSATVIYISLALIFSIATTAFATSSAFDFTSSLATVQKVGNVHSITMNSNYAYTKCTASDLSFRFRITSNNYSWLGLSLDTREPTDSAQEQVYELYCSLEITVR